MWDRVAEVVITMGGMAVIAAVLGICVYLLWVVVPLFESGSAQDIADPDQAAVAIDADEIVELWVDADSRIAAVLDRSGVVTLADLRSGRLIDQRAIFESPSAIALLPSARSGVVGYGDGGIQFFDIGFESSLLDEESLRTLGSSLAAIDEFQDDEREVLSRLIGAPSLVARLAASGVDVRTIEPASLTIDASLLAGLEAPASVADLPIQVVDLPSVGAEIATRLGAGNLIESLATDFGFADRVVFALDLLSALAEQGEDDQSAAFGLLAVRYAALLDVADLGLSGDDGDVLGRVATGISIAESLVSGARAFDIPPDLLQELIDDPRRRERARRVVGAITSLASGDGFAVSLDDDASRIAPAVELGLAESRGLVWRSDRGDLALLTFRVRPEARAAGEGGRPKLLGVSESPDRRRFLAAIWNDGSATLSTRVLVRPLDGSPPRPSLMSRTIDLGATPSGSAPPGFAVDWVFVTGTGEDVLLVSRDGVVRRVGADPDGGLEVMESIDVDRAISHARFVPGARTLVLLAADGWTETLTVAADPTAEASDRRRVVRRPASRASEVDPAAMATSSRERLIGVVDAEGAVDVFHATSRKPIVAFESRLDAPVAMAFGPGSDSVIVLDRSGRFDAWSMSSGYPEASATTLFGRVLYEGETQPAFVYQSSGGEQGGESKLSITPLVFGTLKATVFAMLFAVPIAVLSAIYSSEFLHPRIRKRVKPTIELMASLPSVVLGFVAAIVVAPFVRDALPAVLVSLVVVPLTVMVAASAWQLLPEHRARRMTSGRQLACVAVLLALGLVISAVVGPSLERALFAPDRSDQLVLAGSVERVDRPPAWFGSRDAIGPAEAVRLRREGLAFRDGQVVRPVEPPTDAERTRVQQEIDGRSLGDASIRQWLGGAYGDAFPGWLCVLILPSAVVVWLIRSRVIDRSLARALASATPGRACMIEGVRLLATLFVTLSVAAGAAAVLSAVGLDPRESVLGPFSVRNTLVVGIIMGFAIIPIIYTISEDALRSVPESLRLASLGAGASRWQTAVRIALPVAASGIFSACMIGLGRAVGETMIVLMATGNTPEMSWNIFSGFRTLAANIAVELPEAPPGSTHYRVLFLCGLTLFAMTFVINTTAELVRQRYRKRSSAL